MISKLDLQRLIDRTPDRAPVLSLFLDMSVNSENKRTHNVFLTQRRNEFDELDSDRKGHHREALGETFARAERWLADEFDSANRGVVIYSEVGGDWFEAHQFPVPVQNFLSIGERPVITPLAQVLESYDHVGVVLLDREHVRILSVYLGTLLDEIEIRPDPIPTPHGVQAGGFSQQRYQRRKLEETRHFFRDFAQEVEEFVRRYHAGSLVILGTEENVAQFREFLPQQLQELVVHTGAMAVDASSASVLQKIEPHLKAQREREVFEVLDELRDRVDNAYLATAGYQSTLSALQEGKVDTLVVGRNTSHGGARCTQCGFVFARETPECPFDQKPTEPVVDVVEEMVRMAEGQGAAVEFVDPRDVSAMNGVGALLRF
jgi:peptide subunit release factor 1 (eRF1)